MPSSQRLLHLAYLEVACIGRNLFAVEAKPMRALAGCICGSAMFAVVVGLTGCSFPAAGKRADSTAFGVQGWLHGGQQPVAGATIQLYTVGTTGDGSTATPLLTQAVTTDANGNFSLNGGIYHCTS